MCGFHKEKRSGCLLLLCRTRQGAKYSIVFFIIILKSTSPFPPLSYPSTPAGWVLANKKYLHSFIPFLSPSIAPFFLPTLHSLLVNNHHTRGTQDNQQTTKKRQTPWSGLNYSQLPVNNHIHKDQMITPLPRTAIVATLAIISALLTTSVSAQDTPAPYDCAKISISGNTYDISALKKYDPFSIPLPVFCCHDGSCQKLVQSTQTHTHTHPNRAHNTRHQHTLNIFVVLSLIALTWSRASPRRNILTRSGTTIL